MVKPSVKVKFRLLLIVLLFLGIVFFFSSVDFFKVTYVKNAAVNVSEAFDSIAEKDTPAWPAVLDKAEYDKRLLVLAGYVSPRPNLSTTTSTSTATTTHVAPVYSSSTNVVVPGKRWPSAAIYPNGDAILPFNRILAYYGNFYSKNMGILGEYEPDEVLRRLASTKKLWEDADPTTPVVPAIEYIAMVAQGSAGSDGMYRAVMPDTEIEKAHALAQKANGILILDLQVGLSTIERELPKFKTYITRPDVHIALDPEFSMKSGKRPGTVIGTFSAEDINYAINYISNIVRENKLPPKVLLVHRFTQNMVTGAERIAPTPEVQVVMVMDGWGSKELKRGTYANVIVPEPVQFTGIKLFYKNDLKAPSTGIMTPSETFLLKPKPIYVQYQ